MTAEECIEQSTSTNGAIEILFRKISGAIIPEFSNEEMTVGDTAKLTGLPESAVRAGILWGWLPIGKAVAVSKGFVK